jgi:hypothetical protein
MRPRSYVCDRPDGVLPVVAERQASADRTRLTRSVPGLVLGAHVIAHDSSYHLETVGHLPEHRRYMLGIVRGIL